jgi:hypothetical protein
MMRGACNAPHASEQTSSLARLRYFPPCVVFDGYRNLSEQSVAQSQEPLCLWATLVRTTSERFRIVKRSGFSAMTSRGDLESEINDRDKIQKVVKMTHVARERIWTWVQPA